MDKNSFSKEFAIHYFDLNSNGYVSPTTVVNFFQETAICHSHAVGLGLERLSAMGMGWVIYRWSIKINKGLHWQDKAKITTWAHRFKGLYATREFSITDQWGNPVGQATSLWIFLNTLRGRPMRIPEEISAAYGVNPRRLINDDFSELPQVKNPSQVKNFWVRMSDIDTNQHVNNVRYIDWFLETLPEKVYHHGELTSLEVIYRHSVRFGTMVESQTEEVSGENGEKIFLHRILLADTGKEVAAAKSVWKMG